MSNRRCSYCYCYGSFCYHHHSHHRSCYFSVNLEDAQVPPPVLAPKPQPLSQDVTLYEQVFFDLETTGLGKSRVQNQSLSYHGMQRHTWSGLILGLRPANERRRYFVTASLIGWAQTWNQPWWSCQSIKGSGEGLLPVRCQALTWTNVNLLSFEPLRTNF